MKKEVLCIIFIFVIIGCTPSPEEQPVEPVMVEPEEARADEVTPTEAVAVPEEVSPPQLPDEQTLRLICARERYPPDCNQIPFPNGVAICTKCKEMGFTYEEPYGQEAPSRTSSAPQPASCTGGLITFDHLPVELEKVTFIEPLGKIHTTHVTPVDHQYYKAYNVKEVTVYSPAEGLVKVIEKMEPGEFGEFDWRLEIEHTCTIGSIFIHIDTLAPKLAEKAPQNRKSASVRMPITAGEVLGWYEHSLDFNVVDQDVHLGFLTPELYAGEPWKIHVQDPLVYFTPEVRSQLEAKSLRTAKPIGGRIDYDVDGHLIGNWFVEGTDYSSARPEYWKTHLAIVPDFIDPEHIIVSLGDFNGQPQQFGVNGNSPDPSLVSVATGLVEYELVNYDYYQGGQQWNQQRLVKGLKAENGNDVNGVVLLQLMGDRKVKVEIIPSKTAAQVSGFSEKAVIYER